MSKFKLDRIAKNFDNLKRTLPPVIGNIGQRFFREGFERQGFTDSSFKKWQARKGEIAGGLVPVARKSKGSRAILVKSGHLRNAVNRSLKTTDWNNISFAVNLPYAEVHNFGYHGVQYVKAGKRTATRLAVVGDFAKKGSKVDGSRHNVKSFARRMNIPQRKFMGHSQELMKRVDQQVRTSLQTLHK